VVAIHDAMLDFADEVSQRFGATIHVIGDIDGLPDFVPAKPRLIHMTRHAAPDQRPVVHIAVNYAGTYGSHAPAVTAIDLVIRTGGQKRLSGFLPVESAFAELWFSDRLWPAFDHAEFLAALGWFARQERSGGE
jgi:undecaprenyl pyrophosphate synthase